MKLSQKILAVILVSGILLGGCSPSQNSAPTTSVYEESEDIQLATPTAIPLDQVVGTDAGIAAYYGDRVLLESYDDTNIHYTEYDLATQQLSYIGTAPMYTYGSGSSVITSNGKYLQSYLRLDTGMFSMFMLDLPQKNIEEIEVFDWEPPMQYYELIDDNTVLRFGPKSISTEENKFSYYIDIYTIDTGAVQTLIDMPDSKQGGISCFDYANDQVYTIQFFSVEDPYFLKSYSLDGAEIACYDLSFLETYMEDSDAIRSIRVFNNYVLLWTFKNNSLIVLQIDGEELKSVSLSEDSSKNVLRYSGTKPKTAGDSFGIVYDRVENALIRYDKKKGCIVKQRLILPDGGICQNFQMNEKEEVLVMVSFGELYQNPPINYYRIPSLD